MQNARIDYLEFGIAYGDSFNWWINFNKNPNSRFISFDTFTGFLEKWANFEKGDLSSEGKTPQINDNRHSFQKGLFQDTLPECIKYFSLQQKTIINIDCDLYTSTLFVLTTLAPKLKKDDIIIFDDFNVRYPEDEFRAFYEFINAYKIRYKVICFSKVRGHFAIKLL
ncbi:MAG: class I SAM-dependent methyltransferase [Candidatus Omnitrophota bacterium]|nr:class I SAM-dependent methyltransferase [Candidatus Omnitrophota bacterium]